MSNRWVQPHRLGASSYRANTERMAAAGRIEDLEAALRRLLSAADDAIPYTRVASFHEAIAQAKAALGE